MEKPLLLIVRLSTSVTEILETGILRAEQASQQAAQSHQEKGGCNRRRARLFCRHFLITLEYFHRTEVDGRIVGNALAFGEAEDEHVVGASLFQPRESLGHISVVTVNSQLQ